MFCNHQPKRFSLCKLLLMFCCLWQTFSSSEEFIFIRIMAGLAGRLLAKPVYCEYRVKNNVLIQCQASRLRSNPQTFISPPWAISGGIRGPKETKSWWIELISPPMMDGPVRRGLENVSIVHLSLRLPCPSMICAWVVKATSGQKNSLSPSHSSYRFFPRNSQPFNCLHPHNDIQTARCRKTSLLSGQANINMCHSCFILNTVCRVTL